ncbi:MAG TPA: hypothetical protein VJ851_18820 [Jatrophihabitans sp.]|nr:hypothetical protein [Jatrophihabitans sp.]
MYRTQPPGFRWLVGGFALVAGIAFGWRFLSSDDRPSLIFAVICLVIAGYWLVFDREPEDTEQHDRPEPSEQWPDGV